MRPAAVQATRSALAQDRVRNRRFAVEQVAAEHLAIARKAVALVGGQKLAAAGAVEFWQIVPRDARVLMVDIVEVVVEEQQPEEWRRFDDDRAAAMLLMRLVF